MRLSATTVIYPAGTLPSALDDLRAAGLDGIELQGHHLKWLMQDRSRVVQFHRQLDDHGLAASAFMLGYLFDAASRDAHLALLDLAAEFACAVIPVMAPRADMTDLPHYLELLGQVGTQAESLGITLAVHHHLGTIVNTPEQVDTFLHAAQGQAGIGLCLDTAHLALHGTDIAPAVSRWAASIAHAHVKDLRPDSRINTQTSGARAAQFAFRTPGDGVLDFNSIVPALLSADPAPWLSIEIETFHRPPLESLTTAASTLRGVSA